MVSGLLSNVSGFTKLEDVAAGNPTVFLVLVLMPADLLAVNGAVDSEPSPSYADLIILARFLIASS